MSSAAVVIGVNRTGGLAPLAAAVSGAREVADWLGRNGYDVVRVTDDQGPVTRLAISQAVAQFVDRSTVEKLVVYFGGHGYLNGTSEIWLLSGAPGDPGEAVDQTTSAEMARACNIRNVVFISDCCRSAPVGLLAQRVTGGSIFPNRAGGPVDTEIDHFFATRPGEAAIEAQLDRASKNVGIFTEVLRQAHVDPPEDKLVSAASGKAVPSRWLRTVLPETVDAVAQKKSLVLTQRPQIRLESDNNAFIALAQFTTKSSSPGSDFFTLDEHGNAPRRSERPPARLNRYIGRGSLRPDISDFVGPFLESMDSPSRPASPRSSPPPPPLARQPLPPALQAYGDMLSEDAGLDELASLAAAVAQRPAAGPAIPVQPRSGSDAAVNIAGGTAMEATASHGATVRNNDGARIEVAFPPGRPGCSIALTFADGTGTVVAALRHFECRIAIDSSGVRDISYAPFAGPNEASYRTLSKRIEATRAVASAAAARGLIEVHAKDADALARMTRKYKMFDPALGMIAALAYAAAGRRKQAASVLDYSRHDLSVDLFDIWLLAGAGESKLPRLPFAPMLSQSWSYLDARGVKVDPVLKAAGRHPGFWTTFSRGEMDPIHRQAMNGRLK